MVGGKSGLRRAPKKWPQCKCTLQWEFPVQQYRRPSPSVFCPTKETRIPEEAVVSLAGQKVAESKCRGCVFEVRVLALAPEC